jgi:hypothetical protein
MKIFSSLSESIIIKKNKVVKVSNIKKKIKFLLKTYFPKIATFLSKSKKVLGKLKFKRRIRFLMKIYFPRIAAKISYKRVYGIKLNLNNPNTLSEKLLWLKMNTYRNNKQIMDLGDKYLVRQYLEQKGVAYALNTLYKVYQYPNEIEYNKLPKKFVMKISQSNSLNYFCEDIDKLNIGRLNDTINKWFFRNKLYDRLICNIGGISLKDFKKYIVVEKYIESLQSSSTDYKFYCFNGEPIAILVISDRFSSIKKVFMSPEWEYISNVEKIYNEIETPSKPTSLNEMLRISKKLSEEFPFVRVDLYEVNKKAVFGELSFFPKECIGMSETIINNKTMGELLDIKNEINKTKRF